MQRISRELVLPASALALTAAASVLTGCQSAPSTGCDAAVMTGERLDYFTNGQYQGQDPWVIEDEGFYYVCQSAPVHPTAVYVSKSPSLADQGVRIKVWEDADNFRRVFAPELHQINGKWYIYFCADWSGDNWRHRGVVLEAETDDPQGPYKLANVFFTGVGDEQYGANDFTVLQREDGLYAYWGSLHDVVFSTLVAAKMESPTEIKDDRVVIGPRGEGPRFLYNDEGDVFLTGADGAFASKDYHLQAVRYNPEKGGVLEEHAWEDLGKLYEGTSDVWGPSRASYTKSADGTENYLMYHSKIFFSNDNGMRMVNVAPFTFDENGNPDFGTPPSPFEKQALPSGDPGLGLFYQAEDARLSGVDAAAKHAGFFGEGYVEPLTQRGQGVAFTVKVDEPGLYVATARYACGTYVEAEQKQRPDAYPAAKSSLTIMVNGKAQAVSQYDRTTSWNHWMNQAAVVELKAGVNTLTYARTATDAGETSLDGVWLYKLDDATAKTWQTRGQ